MVGKLEGKVAFITGVARGQGRAHALRLSAEGASIIGIDVCQDIASNPYPLATMADLSETQRLVEGAGGQIHAVQADVRERNALREALDAGIARFGRLDTVVANAGICPMKNVNGALDFVDATDVDLVGVMNTVAVALPHLTNGSSIIITGSTAAMMANTTSNPEAGAGGAGYSWAKQTLMSYTEQMAKHLATEFIRVNCIHPTNCNTNLLHHQDVYNLFRPDLEHPTREDAEPSFTYFQAMPIPYIEPEDVANLAAFLASDDSRYITGQQIRIDGGSLLKFPNGPVG